MEIACLDLEGVLVPEVWIAVAEKTGIEELKLTTRDIADYRVLMNKRIEVLQSHNLTLTDVQNVIDTLEPLPGAQQFVEWLREHFQLVILSDTFYEFAAPLMRKLQRPTLLCHRLEVNKDDVIVDFRLRQEDPKRESVKAFHALNYRVIAAGDSYNDTSMLAEADVGILFRPPANVVEEFPQFSVCHRFDELKAAFVAASNRDLN
ncbi:MAG: bifunctional phosphoserine phosphatase/homoserine phosphotransferase ThrH [Gammaproteobacteria bacterium]|nr:bifunctional phosphoserine phosphatase/homoserine phosphotransferase ThrH [Gammaproteobacteria bacterium]